jgi:hypothetical protein
MSTSLQDKTIPVTFQYLIKRLGFSDSYRVVVLTEIAKSIVSSTWPVNPAW